MSAIVNGIYTIDGYHNVYPLAYKKKFYKIIEDELNNNLKTKKYFKNSKFILLLNNDTKVEPDILSSFIEAVEKYGSQHIIKFWIRNVVP